MTLPHRWLSPPSYGDGDNAWGGQVDYARYGDGRVPIRESFVGNYNARFFGVRGDGLTDAGAPARSMTDTIRQLGGGDVFFPPGVYIFTSYIVHPVDPTINTCLVLGSSTRLIGTPGATIFKLGPNMPNQLRFLTNYNRVSPGGDTDIQIENIIFDGNAGNQPGSVDAQYGPQLSWTRRPQYRNVISRDWFGTTSGGPGPNGTPGEGWCLDFHNSTDGVIAFCKVYDSGVNKTASGFSVNSSTAITHVGNKASNFRFSRGFTHWHCGVIQYTGCHSYLQQNASLGGEGFNSEFSSTVVYDNCVAGGQSSDVAGFPFAGATNLGNASHGFRQDNALGRHSYSACSSSGNGGSGLLITNGSGAQVNQIDAGLYRLNTRYGVEAGDTTTAGLIRFSGRPYVVGNAINQYFDGATANPTIGALTAPAIPGSTANLVNPFPFDCLVEILTGTLTSIKVAGVQFATTAPAFVIVPAGQAINLTYSVTPTWSWVALL